MQCLVGLTAKPFLFSLFQGFSGNNSHASEFFAVICTIYYIYNIFTLDSQQVKPSSKTGQDLDKKKNHSWVPYILKWDFKKHISLCSMYQSDFSALQMTSKEQRLTANSIYSLVHSSADWLGLTGWGWAGPDWPGSQPFGSGQSVSPTSLQVPFWKGSGYLEHSIFMPVNALKVSHLLPSHWPKQVT